ncbi:MAG TPA: cytochrome P450 [Acidimicrobiales bacterium]|nr:cytochrome P450 [Acidimicrobiales bacterium]
MHQSPLGVWILFRHEDVNRVLRDPSMSVEFDNAAPTPMMASLVDDVPGARRDRRSTAILNLDPPDHTRLRRLVQGTFTPKMVEALRPRVQSLVDETLDAMAVDGGTVDVIDRLAFPLPFTVISELLGMPDNVQEREQLRSWAHAIAKTLDPILSPDDVRAAVEAADNMRAYIESVVAWKRANPADDLLSALVSVLDGEELFDQIELLFIAGHETTVNLIGNGVHALLSPAHDDQRRRVIDDPSLAPGMVEEVLRWDSPVQFSRRITLDDITIDGRDIEKGTFVMTCLASSNRDESHWGSDAASFDVGRDAAGLHASFGSGIHHCLGAALARLEGQVALGTFLQRFPAATLDDGGAVRNNRIVLRGFDRLAVSLA